MRLIKTETATIETPTTSTAAVIENLKAQLLTFSEGSAQNQPIFECEKCRDTGMVEEMREEFGRKYAGMTRCRCRAEKIMRRALSVIPPKYSKVNLQSLKADSSRHAEQQRAIKLMRENPHANFAFCGSFGTGKTHLFWTLYEYRVRQSLKTYAGTLSDLLDAYRTAIQKSQQGEFVRVPVSADDLSQDHTSFGLFLDDIDKARPSEYATEQLFNLINAAYNFNHQIVFTTNLSPTQLVAHFERADERFGGAIVRRLIDNTNLIEMF